MQCCIKQALAGIDGVVAYIDVILIFAETQEAHDDILRKVLCHLQDNGFRLHIHKCLFRQHQVTWGTS